MIEHTRSMDCTERAVLCQLLHARRDTIAQHWYTSVAHTGFVPLRMADVQERLRWLVNQTIELLLAEPFEGAAARTIGAALADMQYLKPEALGGTLAVLGRELLAELAPEQEMALQPRMIELLAELATGYSRQAQMTILQRQEEIRRALVIQQLRVEAALRTSEERLRAVVSSAPLILFALDQTGTFTLAEGHGLHTLGLGPDSLLGRSIFGVVSVPQIVDHFRRALAGETFTTVVTVRAFDFETRYAPLRNTSGVIAGVIGVAIDITERKQVLALRESETKYRLLVEHIPAITYIAAFNDASSTLYTSPQITPMLGFSQAEWMADDTLWMKQIHPDDRAAVLSELARIHAGGAPTPCQYRMLTRDGDVVWFRDEAAIMRDKAGQPLYLYGVMLNITERVRLEEELAAIRRQLAKSQEIERRRIAGELHDGAVQRLLGLGYLIDSSRRRLAAGWRTEEQVVAHALTLESLRREVIDIAGQLRTVIGALRPASLDGLGLTTALESYVMRLQEENGADMPAIELDLDQTGTALPEVVAGCLFRVAQEALRNVLKHAQARHASLRLRLQRDEVLLSVCDDGCGFWVPSHLSDLALTNHFGLVGVAEQIDWVGGRLVVESQPDEGTTITVRVRLPEARETDDRYYSCAAGR